MRIACGLLLASIGCGRLAFDPITTDDASIDPGIFPHQRCDSARGVACTSARYELEGSACWMACDDRVTAADASSRCRAAHALLAPLTTTDDEHIVRDVLFPGMASWIGYEQAAGQTTSASGWTWNGTSAATFVRWAAGQPDDEDGTENGAEQCAYLATYGEWQDDDCTRTYRWSCRFSL